MHSKLLVLVALAIGAWSVLVSCQRSDPLAQLATSLGRLEGDTRDIEAVRAIKRLQYAYGHYVELGLWNDFADLFAEDAITNYQQGANGREQIRQLFFDQVGQGRLGLADGRIYPHILFQPVITLSPDGRTAKGRWRILAMLGGFGGSATWYSGVYENEYVLEDGVWKISLLHSEPKVSAAYTAAGWRDSGTRVPFHYTAAGVTAPISNAAGGSDEAAAEATPSLESLADRANQLAHRVARLNDQAEVTNLQDTYGYAVDRKQWDRVASLFAEDGTLELGLRGVYVGKTSIRRALDQFGSQGLAEDEISDHFYLQTLVSVSRDGLSAQARGVELIFTSGSSAVDGELSEGTFENTFVKQDGVWKIQSVRFYPRMIVDAAEGWAESAKTAPGPSTEFPPDRPPTSLYDVYPRFAVAPFHFDNPVTGSPPQYPEGVVAGPRPATPAPLPAGPEINNRADLETRLHEVERGLTAARAYDAAENLIDAYAFYLDESPDEAVGLFAANADPPEASAEPVLVNQVLQPVIDVAADAGRATLRARLLNLRGTSGSPGYWEAATLEGEIAFDEGAWRFLSVSTSTVWTARYPGGWAQTP